MFHFDTFLNNIPPFAQDAPTTNPDLGLSTELVFPGLADGVNFNTPQSTHLNRYQLRDGFSWTLGKHDCAWARSISITTHSGSSTHSEAGP